MTAIKGMPSPHRKLPPDDTLRDLILRQGLNYAEIGRRYGMSPTSVSRYIRNKGWMDCAPAGPSENAEKIVIGRNVLVDGRDFEMARVMISLPRIPTLHGHFTAAVPSIQGA